MKASTALLLFAIAGMLVGIGREGMPGIVPARDGSTGIEQVISSPRLKGCALS
jgi:hypothetical protein